MTQVNAIIQARMSSNRFPGKVLAPFRGQPLIKSVIDHVRVILSPERVIVATSDEISDDPLVQYLNYIECQITRGPLNRVVDRFKLCLSEYPCDWFLRISADSPLINGSIIKTMLSEISPGVDLISNVVNRTFPHGQSVECINVNSFLGLDNQKLSIEDQEHVTTCFYRNPNEFNIVSVENKNQAYSRLNFAVDTVEELHKLNENSIHDFPDIVVKRLT